MSKFKTLKETLSSSIWFLPSIFVIIAIPLSFLLLGIDTRYTTFLTRIIPGLFGGAAESARIVLSTIAGALITVISIAFSITIVALQQAATQYSPRVLRNFTKDRGNQVVLGMYVATFVYALLILRAIRSPANDFQEFVPELSVSFALLLTLVCMGLLIYFINHVSTSLQVEYIIDQINEDFDKQINVLYPERIGTAVDDARLFEEAFSRQHEATHLHTVAAQKPGFIRAVDESILDLMVSENIETIFILPRIGKFVFEGESIVAVSSHTPLDNRLKVMAKEIITIADQRSVEQDPLFCIRQLTDISLRALSPGINDPTTAEYCLHYLGNALSKLASREFPSVHRVLNNGVTSVVANRPTWTDHVAASFDQIRSSARDNAHVTRILIETIERISNNLPSGNRWQPLSDQLNKISDTIDRLSASEAEKEFLSNRIAVAESALRKFSSANTGR